MTEQQGWNYWLCPSADIRTIRRYPEIKVPCNSSNLWGLPYFINNDNHDNWHEPLITVGILGIMFSPGDKFISSSSSPFRLWTCVRSSDCEQNIGQPALTEILNAVWVCPAWLEAFRGLQEGTALMLLKNQTQLQALCFTLHHMDKLSRVSWDTHKTSPGHARRFQQRQSLYFKKSLASFQHPLHSY